MNALKKIIKERHIEIFDRAKKHSADLMQKSDAVIMSFCQSRGIDADNMCFAVVGSIGRHEALEASDFDIIPIATDSKNLDIYKPHDQELRKFIGDELHIKISRGEDLTSPTSVEELIERDTIGGSKDFSKTLTKRILILTESSQAGGRYELSSVREKIIGAYAGEERTSGRHVLTLCNDIARYYKTLCIEYKAKVDEQNKDWCTRNTKLRHSRKVWYFSTMSAIVVSADKHPSGESEFKESILEIFSSTPLERLVYAYADRFPISVGKILEAYALYLQFMSKYSNREALSKVNHSDRYAMELGNPFPAMKFNSDLIHHEIMSLIEAVDQPVRSRMISWFML